MDFRNIFVRFLILPVAVIVFVMLIGYAASFFIRDYIQATISGSIATSPSPLPSASAPLHDQWQNIVRQYENKSVSVQVFQGGKLFRSGTGTVISSDGLILTLSDIVPQGQGYVFQIQDNKSIKRAVPVHRDNLANLVLLKADSVDMNVTSVNASPLQYASEVVLTGKFTGISGLVNFAVPAMITHVMPAGIFISAAADWYLYGAQAILSNGTLAGIIQIRQQRMTLISSEKIDLFIKNYFSLKK